MENWTENEFDMFASHILIFFIVFIFLQVLSNLWAIATPFEVQNVEKYTDEQEHVKALRKTINDKFSQRQ